MFDMDLDPLMWLTFAAIGGFVGLGVSAAAWLLGVTGGTLLVIPLAGGTVGCAFGVWVCRNS